MARTASDCGKLSPIAVAALTLSTSSGSVACLTESGPYTAEDRLRGYAAHLEDHSRQIEAHVAAWRAAHP